MTTVDRFSKMVELSPLKASDAVTVAAVFFKDVVAKHGLPLTITSDRDPRFTGQFWSELMNAYGTALQHSTAFHPQTDGMAEVMNRTMEQLLRIHARSGDWAAKLPLVAMMVNSTPHSRTGISPHEIAYRRKLRMPMDLAVAPMTTEAANSYVEDLQELWRKVQEKLTTQASKDATRADKARRESPIKIGD